MQVGAGRAGRGLVGAALLAGLLTACSGGADKQSEKQPGTAAGTATAAKTAEAVTKGGTLGPAGSACELPVTFDLAADWKAEAVEALSAGDSEAVADLLRQGPVSAACEVDAKPAGHIGYLRVWTGEPGDDDPRKVLEAFVAAEDGNAQERYRTFAADSGVTGAEVAYQHTNELSGETKQEHAFAVVTGSGPVVVHLGGLDDEEHRGMLPAYELARKSLRTG
ncbi:lipoprotein [Streptomyces sp. NPDC096205]|uniref:lipoprotein n=1 Tax=Streptomyces sp. NPDC096205 TaxID=3366081 RepID=UPI0038109312